MADWVEICVVDSPNLDAPAETEKPRPSAADESPTSVVPANSPEQSASSAAEGALVFESMAERDQRLDREVSLDTRDMYRTMRKRELSTWSYNPEAQHLELRRYFVDWLCELAEELHLYSSTAHVACSYFDRVLELTVVPKKRWQLLAITCLRLSAKYEEKEESVPTLADIARVVGRDEQRFTPAYIRDSEICVMTALSWNLACVTSLHCLDYFFGKGVLFTGDTWQGRPLIEKIPRYLRKYADFFASLALQDYSFSQHLPSLLAAAIAVAARQALAIEPLWCDEMLELTDYTESEVMPLERALWDYYEAVFPQHAHGAAHGQAAPLEDGGDEAAIGGAEAEQGEVVAEEAPASAEKTRGALSAAVVEQESPKSVADVLVLA